MRKNDRCRNDRSRFHCMLCSLQLKVRPQMQSQPESSGWHNATSSASTDTKRLRRTRVPDKPNYPLNLWSIMKNCIGKELSKIPMPVRMYIHIYIIIIIIFISFPFIIYRCSTIDLEVVIKYNITLVTLLASSFVHFYYIY